MRRPLILFIALAVLALLPIFVTDSYTRHLFILAFVYAVIASNWDLSLGYAGLFNFGHLTFFAVGVYTAAIVAKTWGIDPWLAIPMGGVTAALTALIVSLPVAHLKGIYVVLVTFGFSQLVLQLILSQSQITGGAGGMVRIPGLEIGDYRFIRDFKFGYYYVSLGLLFVSTIYLFLLTRSPFGKSLLAVRDNEDYAQARGISVARQRVLALVASAIFPGIAGGFFAIYLRVAAPEVLSFGTLSLALSMVLIGGTATIVGPIIAALVLTFATEAMAGIRGMEEARFIVVAVGMILILRFAPGGLARIWSRSTKAGGQP
ncbi:MAG: branched-chain amino acid ABC transporter permease [Pseudomonadota bacterium]